MTDVFIVDPETGLPELPKGLFWRIAQNRVEIRKHKPPTDWRRYIGWYIVVPTDNIEYRTVEKEVTKKVLGLFPRTKTIEVKEYRYKASSVQVWVELTQLNGESEWTDNNSAEKVNKENIKQLCVKALSNYKEHLERNKLYGDYPPKKLEEE